MYLYESINNVPITWNASQITQTVGKYLSITLSNNQVIICLDNLSVFAIINEGHRIHR